MPRTTLPALLLSALATLAAGTGCTTTVAGTAAAAGDSSGAVAQSDADPVAWVDQVCGAMLPFVRTATASPDVRQASDVPALINLITTYAEQTRNATDSAISGMAAAGPSPVDGGDDIVDRLTQRLQTLNTSFQDAQNRVEAVDPNDGQALMAELPAAVAPLQQLEDFPDPTAELRRSPELGRATAQAANCEQVQGEFRR